MGWDEALEDAEEPENEMTELDEEAESDEEEREADAEQEEATNESDASAEEDGGESTETEPDTEESDETSIGDFNVGDIAPNAMTHEESVAKERLNKVLVWANPGDGKTHFAYTMPDPVVIIDTEGKADEIAHKFEGTGNGDPYVFQPENFDEAMDSLKQSFEILRAYKEEFDVIGTVVVDSMSIMWEWAQQKYIDTYYGNVDSADVELTSGIGGGQSDWKKIKDYHNNQFRQQMENCDFHFCWTAMREDDLAEKLQKDLDVAPDKPAGEKNNVYKANTILRIHRRNEEGIPSGTLQKSGAVKYRYSGLEYPTFDKHQAILDALEEVERGEQTVEDVEDEYDITVFEGEPRFENDE